MLEFFRDKSMRRRIGRLIPRDDEINGHIYSNYISTPVGTKMVMALIDLQNFDYDVESRLALELKYGEDL